MYSMLVERNRKKGATMEHLHKILNSILGKFLEPHFSENFMKYRLHFGA